jgi:hypothetical protein
MRRIFLLFCCVFLAGCATSDCIPLDYEHVGTQSTLRLEPLIVSYGFPQYHRQTPHWYSANYLMLSDDEISVLFPIDGTLTGTAYVVVPKRTLLKVYPGFKAWMFDQGLHDGHATFDCDDWVRAFLSYLAFCHFQTVHGLEDGPEGVAVGEVYFWPDGAFSLGHAVIAVVIRDDAVLRVWFFDPMTGRETNLSAQEIRSIWFWRM